MAKFNKTTEKPTAQQPGTTTGQTTTHEGGIAWGRDDKSGLMLLAVVNMVGEDTFYEKAGDRDARFQKLVRSVAVTDPQWMLGFVGWLRNSANMRSASVVAACEAVKARLEGMVKGYDSCMPSTFQEKDVNRQIIDAACARADEPGEVLAYWTSRYGRSIPNPVKRGVADAVARLYNGKALIKYDSKNAGVRFGDVVDLVHPKPAADKPWQGDVFKYALDVRHHPETAVAPESNKTLTNYRNMMAMPVQERRPFLEKAVRTGDGEGAARALQEAGMTWESLAGWLQGPMDRIAWEAIIPSMGAMALVRNLRNFDQAGVNDDMARYVNEKISDPENIRMSKMFPYRMLQAYGAAPSNRWAWALDKALDASCQNVPKLNGKTLVLVDTSGSMTQAVSAKSNIAHMEVGALFGVALAAKGNDVDLCGFANGQFHFPLTKGGSVLKQTEAFCKLAGSVGHGTETIAAIRATFRETVHKRVVIITDGQAFADHNSYRMQGMWDNFNGGGLSVSTVVPADVPLFGIDTTGYSKSSIDTSKPNRYEIGGFSDAMFTVLGLLAEGRNVGYPWEVGK